MTVQLADAIYAAGFFDGEGCISLPMSNGHRYLQITVGNNDGSVLLWFKERFGGKLYQRQEGLHVWSLWRLEAIHDFLSTLYPHLKVKRDQADAALIYCRMKRENLLTTELEENLASIIRDLKVSLRKEA